MVGSISGGNAPGLMAALLKEVSAKQSLEVTLAAKARDVEKMQGEAALKLIETAGNVAGSGKIDVHA
ncbi:hypothetical protein [Methylomonas rivi]|uniref:Motility protein n=1 Tax=Methylomonas rivi TaxID=2952226 RepID=A0ABT1TZC3_9GAMM|nr:hypothetical protein [Methylomonas sp. WSC-6]MCQ8126908.1 hypothetical protein [Methylomonas sp. WSC-6]